MTNYPPSSLLFLGLQRALRVMLVSSLALGAACVNATSASESRGSRDASGITERMAQAGESLTWQDMNEAYDNATVSWLTVYGPQPFLAVKPHIEWAMRAMQAMGWLHEGSRASTAMLDARGDFAQRLEGDGVLMDLDGNGARAVQCRVQINIDENGSSPVLRALGAKSSSVAFLAAHELAHCWFDSLPNAQRLPTVAMLMELGMPLAMARRMHAALRDASAVDGTDRLLDSYDEALADAAATIALVRFEASSVSAGHRVGLALERARAMRLGMLHMSRRNRTQADSHQGGFVFDAILQAPLPALDWDFARRAAAQSVLWSSAFVQAQPRWWAVVAAHTEAAAPGSAASGVEAASSAALRAAWAQAARDHLRTRSASQDEDVFLTASSPAMFAMSLPQEASGVGSRQEAAQLWREVGWFSPKPASDQALQ